MKLEEIATPNGTFAGIKLHKQTEDAIIKYAKKHNIENVIPRNEIHVTLLYNKKHLPNYQPLGSINELATPIKFTIFKSFPSDDEPSRNCLVLLLNCPFLHKRFKTLMKEHDATYDFDEYKPHITFSYDAGNIDTKKIPSFTNKIKLIKEYEETLH